MARRKGLAGGGARARKSVRRQPKTKRALIKARKNFCTKSKKCYGETHLERASFYRGDIIKPYRERILSDAVFPARNGCTFFVTKAESLGHGLPREAHDEGLYLVQSLCQGGRRVEGARRRVATKAEAVKSAEAKAYVRRIKHRGAA